MAKLSDIGKLIIESITSEPVTTAAGKSLVESIKKRTRVGKGVYANESEAIPLPKLKQKTIQNRKRFVQTGSVEVKTTFKEKFKQFIKGKKVKSTKKRRFTVNKEGVDSQFFKPAKSNLTFTGQMLNSVDFVAGENFVDIELNNSEAERKAKAVEKLGFEFMNVSKAELNRAVKDMLKEIEKILSKIKFDGLD